MSILFNFFIGDEETNNKRRKKSVGVFGKFRFFFDKEIKNKNQIVFESFEIPVFIQSQYLVDPLRSKQKLSIGLR